MDAPPPRSPRAVMESRGSVYSIHAETESSGTAPGSAPPSPRVLDAPEVESPPASPRMVNRVSASPAFASLSKALGLEPDGDGSAPAFTRPMLGHQPESNVAGYSDLADDSDDDEKFGFAVADTPPEVPGSAQTATFPVALPPPPIIGTPPGAEKSKGTQDDGPMRFQTINLAGDSPSSMPDTPPTPKDTPQFQAVELDDEHGTPLVQPMDLDKTIAAGRVQSSDSWGLSRQSTLSTMTTLSLGGKSFASSSAESTGASAPFFSICLLTAPQSPPVPEKCAPTLSS